MKNLNETQYTILTSGRPEDLKLINNDLFIDNIKVNLFNNEFTANEIPAVYVIRENGRLLIPFDINEDGQYFSVCLKNEEQDNILFDTFSGMINFYSAKENKTFSNLSIDLEIFENITEEHYFHEEY